MPDKFSATWVSHSSMADFLRCPRLYFLKNVYRDPNTGHKITITSPALALGQAVHDVLEGLSLLKTEDRFRVSLVDRLNTSWIKVAGKLGGFTHPDQEAAARQRGEEMVRRVMKNPGPLKKLAVKIKMDLPHYWLSQEDSIILCGKIDWLEYHPDRDSVSILDFKTGRGEERDDSLQLPIYHLLVANCQKRNVEHAYYWYLERSDEPVEKMLAPLEESRQRVLELAKKVKLARQLERFRCPTDGCRFCTPFEQVVRGEGELVGVNEYNVDMYLLATGETGGELDESVVL